MRVPDWALWTFAGMCVCVASWCFAVGFGWSVEYGTVADWFAAGGSVFAAVTALYIAGRDRIDRKRQLAADQEAQAKLVMVEIGATSNDRNDVVYYVTVENHSALPVLDVSPHSASAAAFEYAHAQLGPAKLEIVQPDGDNRSLGKCLRFIAADGTVVPKVSDQTNGGFKLFTIPKPESQGVVCWVRFADAHGNRWAKSTEHELKFLGRITD